MNQNLSNTAPRINTENGTIFHGVFMEIWGLGVLITGASGIGKSELGLSLIAQGHKLIADDVVMLSKQSDDTLWGSCDPLLQDFLAIRGLGMLNIRSIYGDNAIKEKQQLHLILNLQAFVKHELAMIDSLQGIYTHQTILNSEIPEVTIPVLAGRNFVVLVETLTRKHQLFMNTGYDAGADLCQRQQNSLSNVISIGDNQ